ncbi:MAG: transcription-repair coupling factor [Microcoleus sp. PH2017_25_DOB_D_A]|uniref:transcription-repair coupling factor n=1 Tax=unclassified Microcoleus TaxID=2642155 RepID=UPI001DB92E93|nr:MULTISPECIES: transcription-repair coupling factor [unclassified Microcoleus]TAE36686.1 MAG: transcription-repair coupling factor [Oscillatoriales cyanobacterium]MCC3494364.1 transcription-repair coupling factor [Microcoleus sp. PH2017_16_JOR_D_A]MCC3538401.1 transcription-repair coupling factor [Microcoleus sp. PH2017_25_DOB_D_A]MCC3550535.1 transcription-repair coupling factor [Microcoleus sp. PH2017_24_DOB_U_A]MCC3569404.1 transcription-repair coupling factor [Microcoleus sp. PH2017_31_R
MTFSSIIRTLGRSPLATELLNKLKRHHCLQLNGIARLPKGLVASALAQQEGRNLLAVTATLEEAGRWVAQLEAMGWQTVHFYPTSEASPYELSYSDENEMTWGQMQVLADLVDREQKTANSSKPIAIVATERALQPHLPPRSAFEPYCLTLKRGEVQDSKILDRQLASMGYDRVTLVETEGQWSRRGDIVDVFPVAAELPVRLEWFGDTLDQLREFDPSNQRSLDKVDRLVLTPTSFNAIIKAVLAENNLDKTNQIDSVDIENEAEKYVRRLLGLAFEKPACLLDYLPENTLVVVDEPQGCEGHSDRWFENAQEQWESCNRESEVVDGETPRLPIANLKVPKIHRTFAESIADVAAFDRLELSELAEDSTTQKIKSSSGGEQLPPAVNLSSRPVPVMPHQFAKLSQMLREERDRGFTVFLVSAQPSRSVSLLSEHDCPAQFVVNPRDFLAIDKLQLQHIPVALKYSGLAELEGFILPTFRIVLITDREFYGQHSLATFSYVRKRRRAASKKVDPNKLSPGDYVVHRQHGVGKFLKLERLTIDRETREYLVLQYADGTLRVAADQLGALSRFRTVGDKVPDLNKLTGQTWEKTKAKVRKAVKKVAVDLLNLYAKRAKQQGYAFPPDMPWQQELEDSFPYQPTPDQLKATLDVKRDMEGDRPMDRLVCGDVGFGKTEVALRAIFKAITAGKQVALLAPTTILTQQHYHTLSERFSPYPIEVGLLNRFRTETERREIHKRLATGELDVIVGTQSVLSKAIKFRDLGLLVVDEEQRFGVKQKEAIKSLKTEVDVLTLTATPIPRTLYMSLSGIREMSLIATPPPSRRPIQTHLAPYDLEVVRTAIRQELDRGGQVFYVVPRIEGIDELADTLQLMVPGARIAIAHGQMDAAELESIMLTFSAAEFDILVCTTIIESGLDIPRVNTILIEDAQKFGLGQLYQLRGRVGRAGIQAHAWLFYPKQNQLSDAARQRLRAIQEFAQLGSGYQLAVRDMEIRGSGDVLGTEQSGQMEAIGFDLYAEMLEEAIREIKGQEIPKVEDAQIDLSLTAFIPADYIGDLDQKMSAYRSVASANTLEELQQIRADWCDRYGQIPLPAQQLIRVVELKQIAKQIGFSRIKPENKQHIVLETPMEEPAWNLLKANLPEHLHSRFVYSKGKVTIRGMAVLSAEKQLDNLIDWLGKMQGALPEAKI